MVESGVDKLGRFLATARLPYAHQFLDDLELSAADRTNLYRAIDEINRPTLRDTQHALTAFVASHSPTEVRALSDLGNRLVESHSQFLAIRAWSHVFKHWKVAPPAFHLESLDAPIADYLRFSADIGLRALEADSAAGLDGLEGTHAQLANTAQWQRLRQILRTIEGHIGDRRDVFLAWARSVEPESADLITPLADLERSM